MKIKKDKLKPWLVKGVLGALFCIVVWFIFAPSKEKTEPEASGLDTELPEAKLKPLPDKIQAYQQEEQNQKQGQQMRTLNDYMLHLKEGQNGKPAPDILSLSMEEQKETGSYHPGIPVGGEAFDYLLIENSRLEEEVKTLRRELRETETVNRYKQQQEVLQQMVASSQSSSAPTTIHPEPEWQATTVSPLYNEVVSLMGEELLLDKPYNFDFVTPVGGKTVYGKNTIRACIHQEQTVTSGEKVTLRLLEPLQAGHYTIPKNHLLSGTCKLAGDRMEIHITSIELAGTIIPVKIGVYDRDGMSGVYCPGSMELDATKEIAAGMGTTLGSGITFSSSAGQQIAMDLTRGLISGSSTYLGKKIRQVKVRLPANYELLLISTQ